MPQRQFVSNTPLPPLIVPQIFTDFTPTLGVLRTSTRLKAKSMLKTLQRCCKRFLLTLFGPPTHVLHPVNTNNTCPLRFTATAGTKLVRTKTLYVVIMVNIAPTTLQLSCPHVNNITGSYFRTLSNIPHCSIPQEGGLLLFPLWL